MKNGEQLFPHTPIVFTFIDQRRLPDLPSKSNVTGVTTRLEILKILEDALRLRPHTRHVFVPMGSSRFDRAWEGVLRAKFQHLEGRVEFTYLTGLAMDKLLKRVGNLPNDSLIFCFTFFEDGTGQFFYPEEAISRICESANAPVFSVFSMYLGRGIVGGYLHDVEESGARAGQMARRILSGEKPETVPIETISPNQYMFDWRQLRRWKISENNLPPGSAVLYKPPTIWELYKWDVIGAAASILLEGLLIIALLIHRARRKRAEESLAERLRFEELVAAASRLKPDVVVLDIAMPLLNGLDAARQIKATSPQVKLIFLTMNPDTDMVNEALNLGASGYLLKTSAASELPKAIREALRGKTYLTPHITREMEKAFIENPEGKKLRRDLSPRQREVLQLLAEGRSMKEVAGVLNMAQRTVAYHKYKMMEDLRLKTSAELIQYAVKNHLVST